MNNALYAIGVFANIRYMQVANVWISLPTKVFVKLLLISSEKNVVLQTLNSVVTVFTARIFKLLFTFFLIYFSAI